MLILKRDYYQPIEDYLINYLAETFYFPLLALLDLNKDTKSIINSIHTELFVLHNNLDYLIEAIQDGKVNYFKGEFIGSFNITLSKELKKFADFNARSKRWVVRDIAKVPVELKSAIIDVKYKHEETYKNVNTLFTNLEERFDDIKTELDTPIYSTIKKMDIELEKTFNQLGLKSSLTKEEIKNLADDYNKNQSLNIKNWNPEQITRLRDKLSEAYNSGNFGDKNLIEILQIEFEVTKNKAKFLARQETSLFLSKYRREKSLSAGLRKYKWSAIGGKSGDGRTRDRHKELHGKVFTFGEPPIVDAKTGRRAEPGEDFNCRCVAIPVME